MLFPPRDFQVRINSHSSCQFFTWCQQSTNCHISQILVNEFPMNCISNISAMCIDIVLQHFIKGRFIQVNYFITNQNFSYPAFKSGDIWKDHTVQESRIFCQTDLKWSLIKEKSKIGHLTRIQLDFKIVRYPYGYLDELRKSISLTQ